MEKNIIRFLDEESPREIAGRINNGEFTLSELNDSLADSVKGITDEDTDNISLFFKRERKLDKCITYLE